ncbi:MAG TPA: zf-TFIIB domain-containing protein [Gemmatimonadaceae bacterium]|nr:zf-TFIIB domain-containing protein [Gemmatimonadaceae bacterium]
MSEPALRCPGCGAPATADAASCDYCGSALATVTCASCFAAMFAGSRFCARCGAEVRREAIDEDTPLECPRCRETMQALRLGTTIARECAACGGLWLDPEMLQGLSDGREERAGVMSVLAARMPTAAVPPDVVRYVPCPRCQTLMNRKNFAKSSGVVLDVCAKHGVWLDRGELERVLGFVSTGGLARARTREREQLIEEQRRLVALQSSTRGLAMGGDSGMITYRDADRTPGVIELLFNDALGSILSN